jgi:very-short-patch-repair endonuclease
VLEAAYRDLCDRFGIPQGIRQKNAGGDAWIGRVDVAHPAHKLLVELDSRRWHNTSTAFESDRERSNALVAAGWRVVRITWRMIHDDPEGVARLLRSLLAQAA